MKKISYFIIFFFLLSCIKAQRYPFDTTFFSKGEIKSVKYKWDERYTAYGTIRYFKKSANKLDKNQPIVDTAYANNYGTKKDWTHYEGITRIILHDKSNLYIEKYTKYGYSKDSVYYKINGTYYYLFRELNDLQLEIGYQKDTSIDFFSLGRYDTTEQGKLPKEMFFFSRFKTMKMDTMEAYYSYKCGKYGTVILDFYKSNLLKRFYFYPINLENPGTVYEFYNNFFCKKYGHYCTENLRFIRTV